MSKHLNMILVNEVRERNKRLHVIQDSETAEVV